MFLCFWSGKSEPHVSGVCVFSWASPGHRAVPVDGSVLCLTGILSVIHGDETHPFTCPAFLQRESRVLWTRMRAVRELKCISAGLLCVVGSQEPRKHLLCSLGRSALN